MRSALLIILCLVGCEAKEENKKRTQTATLIERVKETKNFADFDSSTGIASVYGRSDIITFNSSEELFTGKDLEIVGFCRAHNCGQFGYAVFSTSNEVIMLVLRKERSGRNLGFADLQVRYVSGLSFDETDDLKSKILGECRDRISTLPGELPVCTFVN